MSQPLRPSFLQLSINTVTDRVSEGGNSIDELWKLFHSRAELEEKNMIFSLKASNINIHQHEIPHSTSAHAFGILKNYYVYSSRDQALFHENLNNKVVKSLEEIRNECLSNIEHQKLLIRNATKLSSSSYDALEKAKNNYKKAEGELSIASDKLENLINSAEGNDKNSSDRRKDGSVREKEGIVPFTTKLSISDFYSLHLRCREIYQSTII
jgi:hypothetical protein